MEGGGVKKQRGKSCRAQHRKTQKPKSPTNEKKPEQSTRTERESSGDEKSEHTYPPSS